MLTELINKSPQEFKDYLLEKMSSLGYMISPKKEYIKCEYKNGDNSLFAVNFDMANIEVPTKEEGESKNEALEKVYQSVDLLVKRVNDRSGIYIVLSVIEKGYRPQVLFTLNDDDRTGIKTFIDNHETFEGKLDFGIKIDLHKIESLNDEEQTVDLEKYLKGYGIEVYPPSLELTQLAGYLKMPGGEIFGGINLGTDGITSINDKAIENAIEKLSKMYEDRLKERKKKALKKRLLIGFVVLIALAIPIYFWFNYEKPHPDIGFFKDVSRLVSDNWRDDFTGSIVFTPNDPFMVVDGERRIIDEESNLIPTISNNKMRIPLSALFRESDLAELEILIYNTVPNDPINLIVLNTTNNGFLYVDLSLLMMILEKRVIMVQI
jgi:hypothetical protein